MAGGPDMICSYVCVCLCVCLVFVPFYRKHGPETVVFFLFVAFSSGVFIDRFCPSSLPANSQDRAFHVAVRHKTGLAMLFLPTYLSLVLPPPLLSRFTFSLLLFPFLLIILKSHPPPPFFRTLHSIFFGETVLVGTFSKSLKHFCTSELDAAYCL